MLKNLITRLNTLCGYPLTDYSKTESPNSPITGYAPNPLNYHISFECGGVALYQMSSTPGCTGEDSIFNCGHISKRDLYNRIDAYIKGIEAGKQVLRSQQDKEITFTRLDNDINGNPRYVCHWTAISPTGHYDHALKLAKPLGGKKFHNKQYGGGIVFSTYNLDDLRKSIKELVNVK
jgi:hypothetical protein